MTFLKSLIGPPDVEKMKTEGDVPGLIKALRYRKDKYVCRNAADALGEIGDSRAVEPLIAALRDKDDYFGEFVVPEALVKIGPAAVEPLITALKVDNVSAQAAEVLGKIGDEKVIQPLIETLKDEKSPARLKAAGALGEIGAVEAVMPLIAILNETLHKRVGKKFMELSMTAAEALGEIGDVRAVKPLIKYLKHEDLFLPEYQMKAATALGKIGDPQAILSIKYAIDSGSIFLQAWVDNKPPWIDDLFKNVMQDALDKLMAQQELDKPQVVDKITAPVSESLERVVDESQNLVGLWLPDAVDVEEKVPVILSLELIPLPGSYRVVSNSGDERGGCFVMFEAARAPGETEAQYQQSLAAEEWFKKGVLASQQGDFQQAVKCFDKATAGKPFSPEAWNNKAIALASLNRNEEAIQCCDKAIELKPRYADAWDIKGRALGRVGKFHEALPVIEKFIELAPPDATDRVKQAKRAAASLRRRL